MFWNEKRAATTVGKFNKNLISKVHPHCHNSLDRHGPCCLLEYGAEHLILENKRGYY